MKAISCVLSFDWSNAILKKKLSYSNRQFHADTWTDQIVSSLDQSITCHQCNTSGFPSQGSLFFIIDLPGSSTFPNCKRKFKSLKFRWLRVVCSFKMSCFEQIMKVYFFDIFKRFSLQSDALNIVTLYPLEI